MIPTPTVRCHDILAQNLYRFRMVKERMFQRAKAGHIMFQKHVMQRLLRIF
jgi:hypothetical protein